MHKQIAQTKLCPITQKNCQADKCMLWTWSGIWQERHLPYPAKQVGTSDTDGDCALKKS